MAIYNDYLKVKNTRADFDALVQEAISNAKDADSIWTQFLKNGELESKPIDSNTLRTSALAANNALQDVKFAVGSVLNAVFEICSWIGNNIGDRPLDSHTAQISVTLKQGEEFKLYNLLTENTWDGMTPNGHRLNVKKVNRPLQIYSVGEIFNAADMTKSNAVMMGRDMFSEHCQQRTMFNDTIEQLRKMVIYTNINADTMSTVSLRLQAGPMEDYPELDEWNNLKESSGAANALVFFNNIETWMKNIQDYVEILTSNVALFSAALQAVEDDKFTM